MEQLGQHYSRIEKLLGQYDPRIEKLLGQHYLMIEILLGQNDPMIEKVLGQHYPVIEKLLWQHYPRIEKLMGQHSSQASGKRKFKYSKRLVARVSRHNPAKFPSSAWQLVLIIAYSNLSNCLILYNVSIPAILRQKFKEGEMAKYHWLIEINQINSAGLNQAMTFARSWKLLVMPPKLEEFKMIDKKPTSIKQGVSYNLYWKKWKKSAK